MLSLGYFLAFLNKSLLFYNKCAKIYLLIRDGVMVTRMPLEH